MREKNAVENTMSFRGWYNQGKVVTQLLPNVVILKITFLSLFFNMKK